MPEYSSTTITPSDGVQVPGMNGSTSGNFLLSALKSYILSEKGLANGLASLDGNGKLTASQLPDLADDVIVVASYSTLPATGTAGKLYITADNNKMYRWDPDLATPDYVELSVDLSAYATKAELAEEESAREAADSNLLSAIQGNSARIENLEQEHGGYVPVNYRGTNDVPSGKAKYALVESIVGKSRAWNQLLDKSFGSSTTINNVTFTNNGDGSWSISTNGTASGTAYVQLCNDVPTLGHKWLIAGCPSGGSGLSGFTLWDASNSAYDNGSGVVYSPTNAINVYIRVASGTSIPTPIVYRPILRDITTIFPEGVPSTVAECVQKCPDILKYDAFGQRIVDTTVEGVESIGKNLFVPNWVTSSYITENPDGSFTMTQRESALSEQFVVKPNTQYTLSANLSAESRVVIAQLDANGNSVATKNTATWSTTLTTEASTRYMLLNWYPSSTQTIPVTVSNIQIEEGSTATTFSEHFESTLPLPTSVTLRSAGDVAEVYDLETGKKTNPLGSVDLGTLTWYYESANTRFYADLTDAKPTISENPANYLCAKYVNVSPNVFDLDLPNMAMRGGVGSGMVWIRDTSYNDATTFKNAMNGVILYYEKATALAPTQLDPIENNTILTEGGGTINTIQTQTPVIDNSMDVGFLAL